MTGQNRMLDTPSDYIGAGNIDALGMAPRNMRQPKGLNKMLNHRLLNRLEPSAAAEPAAWSEPWIRSRMDNPTDSAMLDLYGGDEESVAMDPRGQPIMLNDPRHPRNRGMMDNPTDSNMMELYGPEESVVQDRNGRPIMLNDPRHPRNQQYQGSPSYPQHRR